MAKSQRELYEEVVKKTPVALSQEDELRLNTLKTQDPDSWRRELNTIEQAQQKQRMQEFDEATAAAIQNQQQQQERQTIETVLTAFNTEHSIEITEDNLAFDIPPRLKEKYESLTDTKFLEEARDYLAQTKVIDYTAPDPENLGAAGGNQGGAGGEIVATTTNTYDDFGA